MIYNITDEPKDVVYRELVKFLSKTASCFLFVKSPQILLEEEGQYLIRLLLPYKISEQNQSSWPGTELLNGKLATVYRFAPTEEAVNVISSAVVGLFAWQQPNFPEDLCFESNDNRALLTSISHEKDAYLNLSEQECHILQTAIPNLKLELSKDYT
jgi:hypothetical protein